MMVYGRDFKYYLKHDHRAVGGYPATPRRHPAFALVLLFATLSVIGVVIAKTHENLTKDATQQSSADAVTQTIAVGIPAPDDEPVASGSSLSAAVPNNWQEVAIAKGDTLSNIFSKLGVSDSLNAVLALREAKQALEQIQPGDTLHVRADGAELEELLYSPHATKTVRVYRNGDEFLVDSENHPIESRLTHIEATITASLFGTGKREGLSDNLIMQLVKLFEYDIDFALDIREGDRFTVFFEERYANGKRLKDGPILAAEFVNQGTVYRAFHFRNEEGRADYYTEDGKNLRKSFVRSPLVFTRISSYFNPSRFHPILHRFRAHKGVDYAAPVGTPVKATADGTVSFLGSQSGYGNVVVIDHWDRYSTLYGHLSAFAKGLKKGDSIKQGEVLGYVGQSGMATGPHLHYEFRIDGAHQDPLTVKLPREPLSAKALADFRTQIAPMLAQLERTRVAQASP